MWSMTVWLIGRFEWNAANVNGQTSVKTTLLFLCQPVHFYLGEWMCEEERKWNILFLCVLRLSGVVCLCVHVEWWRISTAWYSLIPLLCTSGWTEQYSTVWLFVHWFGCWSQQHVVWIVCVEKIDISSLLISKSYDSEIWFLLSLTLKWSRVDWTGLWLVLH